MLISGVTVCGRIFSPAAEFFCLNHTHAVIALVPDGRIQGRWTQKWPSKISCGLGSQRPRKRPNSKFPNCGLILTIICKNWPKNLQQKFFTALFLMIWGVAGLRPNFFSSGRIFLAELAQESWRDLAAVLLPHLTYYLVTAGVCWWTVYSVNFYTNLNVTQESSLF